MPNTELAAYRTITLAAAQRQGLKPVVMPVDSLAKSLPQDGSMACIWERKGSVRGVLRYGVLNVRLVGDRIEVWAESTGEGGGHVASWPLGHGRTVRMLVNA